MPTAAAEHHSNSSAVVPAGRRKESGGPYRRASTGDEPMPADRGSKSCCFCWCCCCSCSWYERPSFEEVKAWGSSFDRLMKCQKFFAEFLKHEYSDENILFWQACEDLKKEKNPEKVEEKARIIYEDFISILSPKEVSLDSRVREVINNNMMHPTPHTFDEAQAQIYTLMHRDSYPRFVNSALYKKLLASYGEMEEL